MIKTQDGETVAKKVEIADNFLKRARGLMFKRKIPKDYAKIFVFEKEKEVDLHMFFVPFDVDAAFLDKNNRVTKIKRLKAWKGRAKGTAQKIIESKNLKNKISKGKKLIIEKTESK